MAGAFFRFYFVMVLLIGLFGLAMNVLSYFKPTLLTQESLWVAFIYPLLIVVIFILSIIAWIKFAKEKMPRVTLVIPIYQIFSHIILFLGSIIWGVYLGVNGANPETAILQSAGVLAMIGIFTSIFEIGFSLFVLLQVSKEI